MWFSSLRITRPTARARRGFRLDLLVMLKTIPAVFTARGAL